MSCARDAVLNPFSFPCNDTANSLCLKHACPLCLSERVDCTSYVSWLPETKVYHYKQNGYNRKSTIRFWSQRIHRYDCSSDKLQTLPAHDSGEYVVIINEKASTILLVKYSHSTLTNLKAWAYYHAFIIESRSRFCWSISVKRFTISFNCQL